MPRKRDRAVTWETRRRKRWAIRQRMAQTGEYHERHPERVWRRRPDLREPAHTEDPVQVGERIWPDLESALEAEV